MVPLCSMDRRIERINEIGGEEPDWLGEVNH